MPDQLIGLVDPGRMDGPMAGRLLDAGYVTKPPGARGADLAKSPAEVVRTSDIEILGKSKRKEEALNTATQFGFRLDRLNISAFHYRMLALIAAGMFFDSFDIYIAGGVLGAMVQSGESTLPLNAAFLSATFVGMMLGAWLSGVLGDRYGRKFCYQLNLLIYGGASLAGALAPSMTWLIGFRFIMGLGMGAEIVVGYGTLSEFIPARHRGRFGTILNLIINTTLFIATFLGWLIIPTYGWRWMFVIAGVGALAVWFMRQSMPESPRWLATKGRDQEADAIIRLAETQSKVDESWKDDSAAANRAQQEGRLSDLFAPRLRMRTITGIVVLVALFIVNYAFVSWVPTFLVKQGHSISNSLGLTALMFAGGPLGSFIGFLLSERIGRKWGIVIFSLLGLVSGVFYVFATSAAALSIAGFAITCIIYVLSSLSIAVYVPELFPTNVRLRGVGLCNATGRAVSIVVPYVVAYTFDRKRNIRSHRANLGYAAGASCRRRCDWSRDASEIAREFGSAGRQFAGQGSRYDVAFRLADQPPDIRIAEMMILPVNRY